MLGVGSLTAYRPLSVPQAPMGNFPQGPGAPPPQLFCCGLFTPLKLLLSVLVTAVALAALYVHLVNPGALSGEALKKAFVASPPPQPGAPPSPPSPPHEVRSSRVGIEGALSSRVGIEARSGDAERRERRETPMQKSGES
jgi:hypothetical protein